MKIWQFLLICFVIISNVDAFIPKGHYKGYVGCFVDDGKRLLKRLAGRHFMSLRKCRLLCRGYKYLGLQYANECWCGNNLNYQKYPQATELQCNMACGAESYRMCGGSSRNAVYKV